MPVGVTFWFPVYPTSTRIHVFIPHPFPHASNALNQKQQNWRRRGKDIRKRFNNFECGCRCLRYQYGRWSVEFNAKRSCDLIWMSGSVSSETKMGFKRKKVSTLPWSNKQGQKRNLYWKVFVPYKNQRRIISFYLLSTFWVTRYIPGCRALEVSVCWEASSSVTLWYCVDGPPNTDSKRGQNQIFIDASSVRS